MTRDDWLPFDFRMQAGLIVLVSVLELQSFVHLLMCICVVRNDDK